MAEPKYCARPRCGHWEHYHELPPRMRDNPAGPAGACYFVACHCAGWMDPMVLAEARRAREEA